MGILAQNAVLKKKKKKGHKYKCYAQLLMNLQSRCTGGKKKDTQSRQVSEIFKSNLIKLLTENKKSRFRLQSQNDSIFFFSYTIILHLLKKNKPKQNKTKAMESSDLATILLLRPQSLHFQACEKGVTT